MKRYFSPLISLVYSAYFILFLLIARDVYLDGLTPLKSLIFFITIVVLSSLLFYKSTYGKFIKEMTLILTFTAFSVEILFQILGIFGLIPGLSHYDEYVPYGRVYCVKEGHGNGIMNRYGWYYPEFQLDEDSKKIVLIGDSFVQGVQINKKQHLGLRLEKYLNKNNVDGIDNEVLAMGLSGAGPAIYFEIMKYAIRHFDPSEIIMFIFIGNDFSDSSYESRYEDASASKYIYYVRDENGDTKLHPESYTAQEKYVNNMESTYQSIFNRATRIVKSHIMTLSIIKYIQLKIAVVKNNTNKEMEAFRDRTKLGMIGLDDSFFRKELTENVLDTHEVVRQILKKCNDYTKSRGISFRIVTIPIFPSSFYERNKSKDWSLEIDDLDFLLPEKAVTKFANEINIPILSMGKFMQDKKLDPKYIQSLYFYNGIGHLTEKGHKYFADEIYSSFYE